MTSWRVCGLWSLNDLYVNQSYLIGTIAAKRKVLSISAPHFTQSDGGRPFKWLVQGHTWSRWQTGCQVGWLPVLCPFSAPGQTETTITWGHAGKTNSKPATGLILTANTKLQCSLGWWSAQSKHRASDREARLAQKRLRLCKALGVFCFQLGLLLCDPECVPLLLWSPVPSVELNVCNPPRIPCWSPKAECDDMRSRPWGGN